MLELICEQRYTWEGVAADSSPYRNRARALNTLSVPGGGVIKFPHPNSRVLIEPGPAWNPMIALKIEVLARVDPRAARSAVVVAGHGSFRFGLLEGVLEARFNNNLGYNNYVRSADAFSPDHKHHPVPANKWVKLGLHHDGFAKMRLFIDDELVGEAIIQGGIPPVQGLGVSIGNDVDQDSLQFPGEIDEVRIWRLDPKAIKREFLGRPYTRNEAQCWEKHFETVIDWMNKNPEQRRSLSQQIGGVQNSLIRSLFLLPDNDQAKLRAILAAFGDLWRAGNIAGPEMEKVLCDMFAQFSALGLHLDGGPANDGLTAAVAEKKIDPRILLECDPQMAALLELLRSASENCSKTTEAAL